MPTLKSPLWCWFYRGEKQNSCYYKAHCLGCLNSHRPANTEPLVIDVDVEPSDLRLLGAAAQVDSVIGEKKSMIAHLIGCPNASKEAKKVATKLKKGSAPDSTDDGESDDDEKSDGPPLKRTRVRVTGKWLPMPLSKLFDDDAPRPADH
ncbi:hypothetical protein B0H14DRAFT_3638937 [Mycena olivaceomarginata]|nr:hypothetical protein B0H14DRAFT_3638937 [Mycena olivaceomarginata]